MVTGAEKSPHGPFHPHETHKQTHAHIYIHTDRPFFLPSVVEGIADVTTETMDLTYRSGDVYLSCGEPCDTQT